MTPDRISKLKGVWLDYAVALAEGAQVDQLCPVNKYGLRCPLGKAESVYALLLGGEFVPSRGQHGDDIIDREKIATCWSQTDGAWYADYGDRVILKAHAGATRREAAMRAFLQVRHGRDEYQFPEDVL